jgi:hypothetical protein
MAEGDGWVRIPLQVPQVGSGGLYSTVALVTDRAKGSAWDSKYERRIGAQSKKAHSTVRAVYV